MDYITYGELQKDQVWRNYNIEGMKINQKTSQQGKISRICQYEYKGEVTEESQYLNICVKFY